MITLMLYIVKQYYKDTNDTDGLYFGTVALDLAYIISASMLTDKLLSVISS